MNRNDRMSMIRQHGDFSLAYSTAVQPELRYFATADGYLAYRQKWGYTYVLGDPVTAPHSAGPIIDQFCGEFAKPCFCQISPRTAALLEARGYYINEMGTDTRIDLETYDFGGKEKERLRYATNWLKRRGFTIKELELSEGNRPEVQALSDAWRSTRPISAREVAFINRPLDLTASEPEVRKFFLLDSDQALVAMVFFDPIYSHGAIVGYVTSFKRRLPTAPKYAEQGITKFAIEQFQQERRAHLMLGLSPFSDIEDREFRYNWFLHHSFRYFYRAGWVNRHYYHFVGHAAFKKRFRGRLEKVYYASPTIVNDLRIFGLIQLCKLV